MTLSIVYSTRNNDPNFVRHLQQTCGFKKVEILAYTNTGDQSLSEVYNHGLQKATNDFIVFIHDDVIFESKNWGHKITQHLQQFDIIGIAGTTNLPKSGIWWEDRLKTLGIVKHRQNGKTWTSSYSGNFTDRVIPAVCVDGVFIAVNRKKLVETFNDNLTGFHFYDIDFCISNFIAGVKIGVIFNVSIIHKSLGQTNEKWDTYRQQFLATHKYNLPCKLKPTVIYDNKRYNLKYYPKISIVILHKSKNFLLLNCLNSLAEKSTYPNYEIIIADTGSSQSELLEIYELANARTNIKIVEFKKYHFASINNEVVFKYSDIKSELILFCNNDIELINDAITSMVQVYQKYRERCGTIGCRLHFANNTIQHAGIYLFKNQYDNLEISHRGLNSYYNFNADGVEKVIGSTAAFLLISRKLFNKIGGFNVAYQICFEDVELNLACLKYNKVNYMTNEAVAFHFESQTRERKISRDDYEKLVEFLRGMSKIVGII